MVSARPHLDLGMLLCCKQPLVSSFGSPGASHDLLLPSVALLASVGSAHTAVAIGFGQLWRGIGQVSGVAVSSAVLQSILDRELKARITGPGSAEVRKLRIAAQGVSWLNLYLI